MKKNLKPATSLLPIPIVVTCADSAGNYNIITIGWVGTINSVPPMLGIGIRPSSHSCSMIKETGEFVVNIPTPELVRATDYCGMVSGLKVDKFKSMGLTPILGEKVKAPLIKECQVSLECVVRDIIPLGSQDYIMGEIVAVTVDDDVINGDAIDISKIRSFTYLPGKYIALGDDIADLGFSIKNQE